MRTIRTLLFAAMVTTVGAYAQTDTPYQVRYASNLNVGDSYINITNTGANGAGLGEGTTANVTGAICVNVYAYDPTEETVSCCSCPVTPNGLVSLSVDRDIISNPLTPRTPTSVVIKLVATAPVGGSCTGSALLAGTPTLANGMLAWGTTIHLQTIAGVSTYQTTEERFAPSTLSAGEQARLAYSCGFVGNQGSTFGVCASCRVGGLAQAGAK
jgi:hypothetical protein